MLPTAHRNARVAARDHAQTVQTWRDAAGLVSIRWRLFVEAEHDRRAWAFASYVASLDAEEAAATELAALASR
jgi:hypothetical protein